MANSKPVFVSPNGGGWKVTQGGRTVSDHRKQQTAIDSGTARGQARWSRTERSRPGAARFGSRTRTATTLYPPRGLTRNHRLEPACFRAPDCRARLWAVGFDGVVVTEEADLLHDVRPQRRLRPAHRHTNSHRSVPLARSR